MHRVRDCIITDKTLDKLVNRFVPKMDVYYFEDDEILHAFLQQGIAVYTREEFHSTFPTFSLEYGSLYRIWTLKVPKKSYVVLVNGSQLGKLSSALRQRLLLEQVKCGRGHVYGADWFDEFVKPQSNTVVTVDDRWYYLLTSDDWWRLHPQTRREWVLKWLRECRKDAPVGVMDFPRVNEGIPYSLIDEYAGTFTDKAGANCFAAAIAMVVGGGTNQNHLQSRALIQQWLHPEPFFRLLKAQGYEKFAECGSIGDLSFVRPADVLIWYTNDGRAAHAAFAVSNELMFQKHSQGWESPWQVLRVYDIWYNHYLRTGGYIAVYRFKNRI